MSFVSVMDTIGHDIKVAWTDVVKYLPAASTLATVIFPAEAAPIAGVVDAIGLIQQSVATVEQKFAAAGAASGTGAQKLAQVLSIVSPTVTALLEKASVAVDQGFVEKLVNAVVAILNVLPAPASVAPSAT